jgi:hypothetical protein
MSESELEWELEKRGRELMRVLLQEHLNKRSPVDMISLSKMPMG